VIPDAGVVDEIVDAAPGRGHILQHAVDDPESVMSLDIGGLPSPISLAMRSVAAPSPIEEAREAGW
jgi:hypothetical protein